MSINEIQDQVIEDFSWYEDWTDKYEYIIDLGKTLEPLDEQFKKDENLIIGCQSKVWLHAYMDANVLKFNADSDAIITKGIIGLLIKVFSGHAPQEIADADLYFLDQIGLQEHLSPNRANGLVSMVKQIRTYGVAYSNLKS
ncbi:MAG: SufE family protein [Chitinophagales bacterium]|nr:SufE family protein [Chitinophagales bacterium]